LQRSPIGFAVEAGVHHHDYPPQLLVVQVALHFVNDTPVDDVAGGHTQRLTKIPPRVSSQPMTACAKSGRESLL
jgi:hypothetical protein